jgi:hypothetical protein
MSLARAVASAAAYKGGVTEALPKSFSTRCGKAGSAVLRCGPAVSYLAPCRRRLSR